MMGQMKQELILEKVISRLNSLGFDVSDQEKTIVIFSVSKMTNKILNSCNIEVVPVGLEDVLVDMSCGDYLKSNGNNITEDDAVKAMSIGDIRIDYGQANSLDSLIAYFFREEGELSCYRKLAW
ncbi:MAG: hypothetical protein RSA49_00080 [Anaerovoracaceae bacterium]